MSKYQRTKGATFERWVVRFLRGFDRWEPRRILQSQGGQVAGSDVHWGPYAIECKVGKLPNPRAALKQAEGDAQADQVPMAVIKDDRCEPFVVMRLADWVECLGEVTCSQ
jgi:hypothetical protein